MNRYCPKCGEMLTGTTEYCGNCGQKLQILPAQDPASKIGTDNTDWRNDNMKKVLISPGRIVMIFVGMLAAAIIFWKVVYGGKSADTMNNSLPLNETNSAASLKTETDNSFLETFELSEYMDNISLLAKKVGARRRESDLFDIFYITDSGSFSAVAEKEHGPVEMLWIDSNKYSLYGIEPEMTEEEAADILENKSWKYNEILDVYERYDYVIRVIYYANENQKTDRISDITYGRYDFMFADFTDDSNTEDTDAPIGNLIVNVDDLRRRKGPLLSAEMSDNTVNTGDCFEVYEVTYGDSYIWYRIDEEDWVASEGTYVTFHPY